MSKVVGFIKRVFQEWNEDKVTRLAASLAYFTIFSIAPLLVVVIAVAGLVLGTEVAQQQIVGQVQSLVGAQAAQMIASLLNNTRSLSDNILTTIIGVVAILLGATGVVGELKDSLNTIWNVTPKPGGGLLRTFLERLFSLGMVMGIGFLLLVSFVVSATVAALGNGIAGYLQNWAILAQLIDLLISFGSVTLLFALLFKFLPDVRVAWRDVWVGSVVTALLFTLGKYALSLYLGRGSVATPFGAAGSLVVLLVWIYYAAQIVFLGAEITQVYANEFGSGMVAKPDAVALTDAARVEQGTRTPNLTTQGATQATATAKTETAGQDHATTAPPSTVSVPQPLYMQLTRPKIGTRGAFNPIKMVRGAIGIRLYGSVAHLLERAVPGHSQH